MPCQQRLHQRNQVALGGVLDEDAPFALGRALEALRVFLAQHPLGHRPGHVGEAGQEVMAVERESGHAVDGVGDQPRALRQLGHADALRSRLRAELGLDQPYRLRVRRQRHAPGLGRGLSGLVVGGGADAAETEHDLRLRSAPGQGAHDVFTRIPHHLHPADGLAVAAQQFDHVRQVGVVARATQQLVADEQQAEAGAVSHPRPAVGWPDCDPGRPAGARPRGRPGVLPRRPAPPR